MSAQIIHVLGMTCSHCVEAVRSAVSAVPGVRDVDVDLLSGELRVGSDVPVDEAALREAVASAGYEAAA